MWKICFFSYLWKNVMHHFKQPSAPFVLTSNFSWSFLEAWLTSSLDVSLVFEVFLSIFFHVLFHHSFRSFHSFLLYLSSLYQHFTPYLSLFQLFFNTLIVLFSTHLFPFYHSSSPVSMFLYFLPLSFSVCFSPIFCFSEVTVS